MYKKHNILHFHVFMVTKDKAIEFAVELGWTKEDAKRAYKQANLDFSSITEGDRFPLALALADFAGEVLLDRQRAQAAQKAQVTKRTKEIKQIKIEYKERIEHFEETLLRERSSFVSLIARIYSLGKIFGLKDPWVETLLEQYEEYIQTDNELRVG